MTKLEQFVALMEEKYNHPITIDGDKLIVDKQTSENMYEKYGVKSNIHVEIDTKVFDLSDMKNDMHRFYYIVESYMLYDLFLYAGCQYADFDDIDETEHKHIIESAVHYVFVDY